MAVERQANPALARPLPGAGPSLVRAQWLHAVILGLALIGYPLAGSITTILDVEGSTVSYAFRGLVLLFGVILVGMAMNQRRLAAIPLAITLFYLLYLTRLFTDAFIRELYEADYALMFFIGVTLLPALALGMAARFYDDRKAAVALLVIAGVGAAAILLLHNFADTADPTGFEDTRRLAFTALNAITVGYTGLFTIMAGIIVWPRAPYWLRPVMIGLMVIAAVVLVQSASRGPLVAGAACIAAVAFAKRKWYIFALFLIAAIYGLTFLESSDLEIVDRFRSIATEQSANQRLLIQAVSIELALEHPLLGHAYAETFNYYYPHNLIIESGLALGIVGFGIMLYLEARLLLLVIAMLKRGLILLPLLLLTALINANLSSSLWNGADFWVLASITLVLDRFMRNQQPIKPIAVEAGRPAFSGGAGRI